VVTCRQGRSDGFRRAVAVPLGMALCGIFAGGCFDPHEVDDPGLALEWSTARAVDNAERTDGRPSWSMLARWVSWSWPPDGATCGTAEPGARDRGHARALIFDVEPEPTDDEPDPALVYTSAGLYASGVIHFDLSDYDTFVFSAKLEPDAAYPRPDGLELLIQFDCPGAASFDLGPDDEPPSLASAVAAVAGSGWQRFSLALEDFIQPSWQIESGHGIDPSRCLHHVHGIGVVVGVNVPGQRLAGTLSVDDIELGTLHRAHRRTLPDVSLSPWACYDLDGVPDPSCDASPKDAVVTLGEGPAGDALIGQARCANVVTLDDSSVLRQAELDLSGFDELGLAATFSPANSANRDRGRFAVRLSCFDGSEQASSVARSFEVSSGLASYRLALSSFARDYPLQVRCLEHVDSVCLETDNSTTENAVAGTLSVEELVLR
jgi:hypothetical protein